MFKNLSAGGQTTAHGARMLWQVVKIGCIIGLTFSIGYFCFKMWEYPHERYTAFPKYFKALISWNTDALEYYDWAMAKVFEYAFLQIKPSLIFGGWVFLISAVMFQMKGIFGKRKKKIKRKSSVKKVRIKNPFHRGFFIGKASLPKGSETKHILVSGGTGSGKTNAFHHIIPQIRQKGQKAVIVDTTGIFIKRYYQKDIDVILDPKHPETKLWTPWEDAYDSMDYQALAKAFIPIRDSDHDSYWKESAATVFASLLEVLQKQNLKSLETLSETLLQKPLNSLIQVLEGTAAMAHISKEGEKSTASIRSTAAAHLTCLKHLKTPKKGQAFSINRWIADDSQKGFLFLGCNPKTRDALKPLLSAWYSTAIRAIMCLPPSHRRRIWFINDELPSMDKINGLVTCLTEGRKYGACALLAVQSPSQLIDIYGSSTSKTITANCNTKIVFKESEPSNSKQLSQLFGEQEVQEIQEGLSYGAHQMRDGVNQSKILRNRSVISPTDIQNLKTNQCFLRKDGNIERVKLKFVKEKKKEISAVLEKVTQAEPPERKIHISNFREENAEGFTPLAEENSTLKN